MFGTNASEPRLRDCHGGDDVVLTRIGDRQEGGGSCVTPRNGNIFDRVEPSEDEIARSAHDAAYRRAVACIIPVAVIDVHSGYIPGQSGACNGKRATTSLKTEQRKLLDHRNSVGPSARRVADYEPMEFEILLSVLLRATPTFCPDRFEVSRPILSRVGIERVTARLARILSAFPVAAISGHCAARK